MDKIDNPTKTNSGIQTHTQDQVITLQSFKTKNTRNVGIDKDSAILQIINNIVIIVTNATIIKSPYLIDIIVL